MLGSPWCSPACATFGIDPMRLLALVAAAIFGIDQITKYLVVHVLDLKNVLLIEVAPPYLRFVMAWNEGINFGLFSGSGNTRWILIAIAAVIVGGVLWWLRDMTLRLPLIFGGILVGGALGNVVDRVLYGAVADVLNMSCCGINNPFAFNVADIAIFVGAVGLIIFTPDPKKPG